MVDNPGIILTVFIGQMIPFCQEEYILQSARLRQARLNPRSSGTTEAVDTPYVPCGWPQG
jgi:hypothetical protein